jgi:hypothetical protein
MYLNTLRLRPSAEAIRRPVGTPTNLCPDRPRVRDTQRGVMIKADPTDHPEVATIPRTRRTRPTHSRR